MAGGQASAYKIKLAERRLIALTLRKQGGSYRAIAEQMRQMEGISPRYSFRQAHADVTACLRELLAKRQDLAEEYFALELERLNDLLAVWYPKARKGDPLATQMVLNILDREVRLLGLAAPARIEATGKDGGPLTTYATGVVLYIPDNGRGDAEALVRDHYHEAPEGAPDEVPLLSS